MKSPTRTRAVCLSISSTHQRFPVFSAWLADFLREKKQWRRRTELGKPQSRDPQKHRCRDAQKHQCLHSKTPMPRLRKHHCLLHSKTPMPRLRKHHCLLHSKTPMPRPEKHQCLRAKTPLPAHPMWPRPSAYTREFPKLTCVGTQPVSEANVHAQPASEANVPVVAPKQKSVSFKFGAPLPARDPN